MSKSDFRSSLIWLICAAAICIESYRLGIGTLHAPGPGLYPLGIGLIMVVLSGAIVLSSLFGEKAQRSDEQPEEKTNPKALLLVLISLFVYAVILERVGFLLSTAFFIIFILKVIEKKKWYVAVSFAIFTTAVVYVVFNLWLDSNLPRGILGP